MQLVQLELSVEVRVFDLQGEGTCVLQEELQEGATSTGMLQAGQR